MALPSVEARDPHGTLIAERVHEHAALVRTSGLGNAMAAIAIAMVQRDVVPERQVVLALTVLLLPVAGRMLLVNAWRQSVQAVPATWLPWFRAGHALQAAAWGVAGVLLFPAGSVTHQVFLFFALSGMVAAAVTLTAFDLLSGMLFLVLALGPGMGRLFVEGGDVPATVAIVMGLFVAFMAANARRSHGQWREALRVRQAEKERTEELRTLNATLERVVEERTGALVEHDARFRAVFDQSPAALALISLDDHRLVEVNDAWQSAFGFTRDEVIGRTSGELGLWVDVEARRRTLDELQARGAIAGIEAEMRHKDGTRFTVLIHSSTLAIGGQPYSLSTLVDVTERNRALQGLAESEARFRAVFDKGPIVFSLIRLADDRFVEVNDAALRTFGYARDEVIGHTALELDLWVDQAERDRIIEALKRDGTVTGAEARLRRKGGEVFWALFSSSVITIGGEPYSLSTLQDITERRQLEAQFLQSQKMEVLGHLAGGVAHDFNNVLTVIRSTAELALDQAVPASPLHEALDTIRDASARASELTTQLLAVGRRQVLQPAVIDLNEVVRDLTPMLRRAIGERVTFSARRSAAPATILADRSRIEQVLLNLAINARDAMPDGGTLIVAITLSPPSTAPRQVTVTIADTGIGMDEATQQRVFEPFFTTKDAGKGTGLGLSTAHGIVTQSGGRIAVRSAPGAGTTFTVSLPWVEAAPVRPAPSPVRPAGGHETILVVDDDSGIRDVVRRALSSAGYQVLISASGDDALQLLGRHQGPVHLLLTDVVMPGLSGPDLAEQVHVEHPSMRILFSSGFVHDAVVAHGNLGDAPFIAKPYSLKALTQKVREVLDADALQPTRH